jgi:serine protease
VRVEKRIGIRISIVMLVAGACADELPTVPNVSGLVSPHVLANQDQILPRGAETKLPHWGMAQDSALWNELVALDSLATIGLKKPGTARGAWRGRFLVSATELVEGRRAILQYPGIRLVRVDTLIPAIRVKVADFRALAQLRRLPFVDYVEPTLVRIRQFDNSGCDPSTSPGPFTTLAASTGGADTVPHSFPSMGITRAWAYSTGAGITIGLTDTGVDNTGTSEFSPTFFASGMSTGRSFAQSHSSWDNTIDCSHGSRVAGLAAAPRNGRQIVGAAYNSSVYSVHQADGVAFVTDWEIEDAQQAIHDAAYYGGAKVIVMAWGASTYHHAVADEIRAWYNVHDRMFVGAAGTCSQGVLCGSMNDVRFPADMEEVLAASASNEDGSRSSTVNYGNQVDVIAYANQETTGMYTLTIQKIGGSSAAAAIVGGVAALVRARYPYMTNLQAMQRIVQTSGTLCGAPLVWRDILINAEAAVGGICVPWGRPTGPYQVWFDHQASGDTRQSQSQQYCIYPTGGTGSLEIMWANGELANCHSVTFYRGTYSTVVSVSIRDTGASLPARTFNMTVQVSDLDETCPTCP